MGENGYAGRNFTCCLIFIKYGYLLQAYSICKTESISVIKDEEIFSLETTDNEKEGGTSNSGATSNDSDSDECFPGGAWEDEK